MTLWVALGIRPPVTPAGIPEVAAWRCQRVMGQSVDLAIRHGMFGGPYAPPTLRNFLVADVFLQWADGLCTHATVNRSQLDHPEECLRSLYHQSYHEKHPDMVPGPVATAEVRVCVPEVRTAIQEEPAALYAPVQWLERELRSVGTDQVRAFLSAQYSQITFASSEGAWNEYETTRVSFGTDLGSRAMFSRSSRSLPTEEDVLSRVHRVRQDFETMNRPAQALPENLPILLSPDLTQQFLNYYLLNNLNMQTVLNGASAFTRQDVEEGSPLFHPTLSVLDLPLRHDHATAFCLDERGQAPRQRYLIHQGRLVDADVSLRAAAQSGLLPTPTSLIGNWVLPPSSGEAPDVGAGLEECLRPIGDALYLYSILGLHTQDPTRGAYSLGVPRAVVFRGGRVEGFVRGTLSGNFFQDLRSPLETYEDPLFDKPILRLRGRFAYGT